MFLFAVLLRYNGTVEEVDGRPQTSLLRLGEASVLVHNEPWCTKVWKHWGEASPALKKLEQEGFRLHGHHIVMKGEFATKPGIRKAVLESQEILKKYDIDVFEGKENLCWAINHDHSQAYAEAVLRELRKANKKGTREEVENVLRRIANVLGEGSVFRGFNKK